MHHACHVQSTSRCQVDSRQHVAGDTRVARHSVRKCASVSAWHGRGVPVGTLCVQIPASGLRTSGLIQQSRGLALRHVLCGLIGRRTHLVSSRRE